MTDPTLEHPSVLLRRHGAVAASGPDAGVAAHYGDPVREQRALVRGRAVVDQSQRGVLTVSGPDRLSWLTTLSSQVLTGLRPGESTETLFLSVQGRIEFAPHVLDDGTTTWLVTEHAEAPGLAAWLTAMRFALRVEIQDVSEQWAVLAATRDLSGELAGLLPGHDAPPSVPVWHDPWPGVAAGGHAYAAVDGHPGGQRAWCEHLVPRAHLDTVVSGLERDGFSLAGSWAAEALRIEAWRPRWGVDTDEKTIPHELDWMRTAVHLSKGCYKGQETVARVHNLGHPPRRITFLDLDGSQHTLPESGAVVELGGRTVGRITAAQLHHEAGPIALAVLKRSVDPAAVLTVRDVVAPDSRAQQDPAAGAAAPDAGQSEQWAASQTVVVPPDAGSVVGRAEGLMRGPRGGGTRL
ncbi:CAF17-like 4Fe-4S cluster assembly/insertion protein YgfZ [Kocuria tytonis]|uniref:Folate-binding protein n=1 Tax=Kocuria tytonis TaxID=2054280 RepID=A0A495AA72_9MICC|nr:folate-binding protein YgfZ [Kocuria tytonis]RKQ36967.1 folate-binding protein [Kocuria tytonis]